MTEMEKMIEQLNKWQIAYNKGFPIVSDEEYDNLYFKLKELENTTGVIYPNSPTQRVNVDNCFQVVDKLEKVTHNHLMLSLDKTKSVDEVISFLNKKDYLAMCKMDGLTCSLKYVAGKLVAAETRGNGVEGENVLHNALTIKSIPKSIPYKEDLVIDGEVICTYGDFEDFSTVFSNPRNFVAGSIQLLDANECANRKLSFVAWEIIEGLDDIDNLSDALLKLSSFGFTTVPFSKKGNYTDDIEFLQSEAKDNGYPIDGVVFKFDSRSYGRTLGKTEHHFKNAIAYKFYDETYDSVLLDIEWTMGRTGILTPVAIFEPIVIDGARIERSSLHNVSIMQKTLGKYPYVNEEVKIYRANQIIPQIAEAGPQYNGEDIPFNVIKNPTFCPVCGQPVIYKTSDEGIVNAYCANPDCSGKLINQLDHFCGKKGLDIKGLSVATLEKLINWNWINSIVDIFNLKSFRNDWIKKAGFGNKSVDNILNAIEEKRKVELYQFISALGIPLIGSTYAKQIARKVDTWETFVSMCTSGFSFESWDGFGYEMSESLRSYDFTKANIIFSYLEVSNSLWAESSNNAERKVKLCDGIVFVVTGSLKEFKNRAELQAKIESEGGKVVGSVSRNTNYLINNDATSSSAKNVAAKKLGVPIITEQEFKKIFDLDEKK